MQAKVNWIDNVHFRATSGTGHDVELDGPPESGGENLGCRPMEMLLMGLGGCASYDVVTILRKSRNEVSGCEVQVTAERVDAVPAVFESIHLHFTVTGQNLDEKKVSRAVELSADKYCSASIMLGKAGVKMTHDFSVVTA